MAMYDEDIDPDEVFRDGDESSVETDVDEMRELNFGQDEDANYRAFSEIAIDTDDGDVSEADRIL
jgi:hypothetical protein